MDSTEQEKRSHGGKRANAGRPKGTSKEKQPTYVVRVPAEISKDHIEAIPSLRTVLDHWEDECNANPDAVRYYFLRQALEEIRALGL